MQSFFDIRLALYEIWGGEGSNLPPGKKQPLKIATLLGLKLSLNVDVLHIICTSMACEGWETLSQYYQVWIFINWMLT